MVESIRNMIKDGQIDQLLKVHWNSVIFEEEFDGVLDSLLDLVSREVNQSTRFSMIVKRIFGFIFQGPHEGDYPIERLSQVFDAIHDCLRSLVAMSQRTSDTIMRALRSSFPYFNVPTHRMCRFIENYLRSTDYFLEPEKTKVLKSVIDKLHFSDLKANVKSKPLQEVFEMETASDGDIEEPLPDHIVKILIEFINERVFENGKYNPDHGLSMFEWIFPLFLELQMNSKQTNTSQYLMFYLIHLDVSFIDTFISRLWLYATDVEYPAVNRSMAVYYISSLLSRSSVIKFSQTWNFINDSATWLNMYIEENDDVDLPSSQRKGTLMTIVTKHQPFYAVFQAMMSVLISSYQELTPEVLKMLRLLDIQKILNSNLNPLLICQTQLLESFATISSTHQIAACSMIIRGNQRTFPISEETFKEFHIWSPYDSIPGPLIAGFVSKFLHQNLVTRKEFDQATRHRIPSESHSPNFVHGSGSFKPDTLLYQDDPLHVINSLDL